MVQERERDLLEREKESRERERYRNILTCIPQSNIYKGEKSLLKNTFRSPLIEIVNPNLRFTGGTSSELQIKCSNSLFYSVLKNACNRAIRFRKFLDTQNGLFSGTKTDGKLRRPIQDVA